MTSMRLHNLLWLILLSALWGSSFLFIKICVAELPPFTLVAISMSASALLLYLVVRWRGHKLPADPVLWKRMAVLALFGTALPFVLLGWGQQYIDSAIAGILDSTMPLFTLLLAHFFVKDDRINRKKALGMMLGFLGAVVLVNPFSQSEFEVSTLGVLAVTACAFFYAVAAVYAKLHVPGMVPLTAPTMQFGISALYLIPLSLLVDRPWTLAIPSSKFFWAWAGLVILGTVAAYAVYYHLLERAPVSFLSLVAYLAPIVAVILGISVLGEAIHWTAYLGGAAILTGLLVIHGIPKRAAAGEEGSDSAMEEMDDMSLNNLSTN